METIGKLLNKEPRFQCEEFQAALLADRVQTPATDLRCDRSKTGLGRLKLGRQVEGFGV